MRRIHRLTFALPILAAAGLMSALPPVSAAAAQAPGSGPVPHVHGPSVQTNSHWSGYVTTSGNDKSVQASWVEPRVDCSQGGDVLFWVGLGGYGNNMPLTQDGTYVQCQGGRASYSDWWETWPCNDIQQFNDDVEPGDNITATVTLTGNNRYRLTVSDKTRGWTENPTVTGCNGGSTASAEVVTETPSYGSQFADLPDFGTVTYTNASVNSSALGSSNPFPIDMARGSDHLDSTSALSGGGTSFGNTWLASS